MKEKISKTAEIVDLKPLFLNGGILTLFLGFFFFWSKSINPAEDVINYYYYARTITGGALPYKDVILEYPPFSIPFFLLPQLFNLISGANNQAQYILFWNIEIYLILLATLVIVWLLFRKLYPTEDLAYKLMLFSLALVIFVYYIVRRYDLAPAFLVILSLYLFLSKKPGWSGVILGLATAAKLYPALLLPLYLLYLWPAKDKVNHIQRLVVGFIIAVAVTVVPFLVLSPAGLFASFKYQGERSLEIESVFASITWLGQLPGLTRATVLLDHSSVNYYSSWSGFLELLSTFMMLSGLLAIYFFLWRNIKKRNLSPSPDWLLQVTGIVFLWFILTNRVFSPQYMVWLVCFVPFWPRPRIWLFLAALLLSYAAFPVMVAETIAGNWVPLLAILLRNLLLIILLVLLIRDFIKGSLWEGASAADQATNYSESDNY